MDRRITIVVLLLSIIALYTTVSASDYCVKWNGSGDFQTIQEAIDAAQHGDTVIVHPGTYVENAGFDGKDIVLRSIEPVEYHSIVLLTRPGKLR